jgi:hypothetical protein
MQLDDFKIVMKKEIEMIDLGLMSYFLRIEVEKSSKGILYVIISILQTSSRGSGWKNINQQKHLLLLVQN